MVKIIVRPKTNRKWKDQQVMKIKKDQQVMKIKHRRTTVDKEQASIEFLNQTTRKISGATQGETSQ